MRIARILLAAGAGMALATPAAAQTQAELNARAGADWKAADAALNAQWRRTWAAMKSRDRDSGDRAGTLAAATLAGQRAWLVYRDRQCAAEAARFAGGSMQPMAAAECRARVTRARTRELASMDWTR